jgi:hypothetical protein
VKDVVECESSPSILRNLFTTILTALCATLQSILHNTPAYSPQYPRALSTAIFTILGSTPHNALHNPAGHSSEHSKTLHDILHDKPINEKFGFKTIL